MLHIRQVINRYTDNAMYIKMVGINSSVDGSSASGVWERESKCSQWEGQPLQRHSLSVLFQVGL